MEFSKCTHLMLFSLLPVFFLDFTRLLGNTSFFPKCIYLIFAHNEFLLWLFCLLIQSCTVFMQSIPGTWHLTTQKYVVSSVNLENSLCTLPQDHLQISQNKIIPRHQSVGVPLLHLEKCSFFFNLCFHI